MINNTTIISTPLFIGYNVHMDIWIDGYEANVLQRLGSSKVAFELLIYLEKIDKKNEYTILIPDLPLADLPKERKGWKYKILKPKRLWTRIALPLALYTAKIKPDIIFSPTHYIPRFSPVKRLVTIFDLSFLHFPQMFKKSDLWQLTNWTKFSIQNSDHIMTISNSSKQDIIKEYKIDEKKITVVYPGYDRKLFYNKKEKFSSKGGSSSGRKVEEVKKKYQIGDNYIIYIGTLQPRKNLIRLIEAVSRIDELILVIVGKTTGEGKEGWLYQDILEAPRRLGIEERVKFLGFVPRDDLPMLLSGGKAFVLPSLWEGFGITVVEAMACRVPVIVSNVSSLPEVVGKAGLLVDPYSVDQIEQAIRTVTIDKRLQQKYANLAFKQARKFSWEKMARGVLKVLENYA